MIMCSKHDNDNDNNNDNHHYPTKTSSMRTTTRRRIDGEWDRSPRMNSHTTTEIGRDTIVVAIVVPWRINSGRTGTMPTTLLRSFLTVIIPRTAVMKSTSTRHCHHTHPRRPTGTTCGVDMPRRAMEDWDCCCCSYSASPQTVVISSTTRRRRPHLLKSSTRSRYPHCTGCY